MACFSEKQPHSCHRRGAGAQVEAKLAAPPRGRTLQVGEMLISDLKDAGIIDRAGEFHGDDRRLGADPFLKRFVPLAVVVAQQVDLVELHRRQKRLCGAAIPS